MECTHFKFWHIHIPCNHYNNQDREHFYHLASQSSPCSLAVNPLQPLAFTYIVMFMIGFAYSTTWNKCSYIVCTLPIWLLPLSMFRKFIHVVRFSLLLSTSPLFEHTVICLSGHHKMCIWVVSIFWLPWIRLLKTFVYKSYHENMFLYLPKYYLIEYFMQLCSNKVMAVLKI